MNNLLTTPSVIEQISYEKILQENEKLLNEILKAKGIDYVPVQSDTYQILLQAFSQREYLNRLKDNEKIKKMLPHYAKDNDLDHCIYALYGGILRNENEDDEEFLKRAMLSVNRFSTAGSKKSYEFYTYSASATIDDVKVKRARAGVVDIYIASKDVVTNTLLEKVTNTLNKEDVRPLTDQVVVKAASIKNVTISSTIKLFDLSQEQIIDKQIQENFSKFYKIGEEIVYSDLIAKLHIPGVYKVSTNINTDITTLDTEVLKITLNLNYVQKV